MNDLQAIQEMLGQMGYRIEKQLKIANLVAIAKGLWDINNDSGDVYWEEAIKLMGVENK